MTGALALAVALGAAVGAPLRFGVERAMLRAAGAAVPWGTLLVNVAGSFILGVVLGSARSGGLSEWWVALIGTGLCGALTTFSGFSAQVLELSGWGVERRPWSWRGVTYAAASLVLGIASAAIGYAVTAA